MAPAPRLGSEVAQRYLDTIYSDATPAEKLKELAGEINGKLDQFSDKDQDDLVQALKLHMEEQKLTSCITEGKLTNLETRLKKLEAAAAIPAPAPRAAPTTPKVAPAQREDINIRADAKQWAETQGETVGNAIGGSTGQRLGKEWFGYVGGMAGGGVEGVVKLARREFAMISDPNVSTGDKFLRYSFGLAAIWGGVSILRKIVSLGHKKETDPATGKEVTKSRSPWWWKTLSILGVATGATYLLNKAGPWADKKMAEQKEWEGRAETRLDNKKREAERKIAAEKAAKDRAERAKAAADLAKQLTEDTDLKKSAYEININDEKTKFQVTDKGIKINGIAYEVSTEKPTHWVNTIDTVLHPHITKATWQRDGIAIDATVKFKKHKSLINKGIENAEEKYENKIIPFEKIPAFFAQAKTGKSFVYTHALGLGLINKDFSFNKMPDKPAV